MLIRSILDEDRPNRIKLKYFGFQYCLTNSKQETSIIVSYLIQFLYFVVTVSLFFKSISFAQPQVNKFFKWFVITQATKNFDINQIVIFAFMVIFFVIFAFMMVYNYLVKTSNSFSCRFLVTLFQLYILFSASLSQFYINVIITQHQEQFTIIFKVFALISIILCTICCSLYLKFKIKPLRKGNSLSWSFSNDYQLHRFILSVGRSLIIAVDGVNLWFVVVSAFLELVIITKLKQNKFQQKKYFIKIQTSSNLIISTHIGIILVLVFDSSHLADKVWLTLVTISILKGIYSYIHELNRPLQLPSCNSGPFQFYDFYYRIMDKFETSNPIEFQSNQTIYYTTFKQHTRKCKQPSCLLRYKCIMKRNVLNQIQSFISQILRKHKYQSNQFEILQQLWKHQRGKKFQVRNLEDKDQSVEMQYVVFMMGGNNDVDLEEYYGSNKLLNSNNKELANNVFYDSLQNILLSFSQLFAEISKVKPRIQSITRIGEDLRIKVEQIQSLYMQLLKRKTITFKAIQLYIQFENYFLQANPLNYDLMKKIISIQKNISIDEIQQIYLPAICVYSQTGVIQNVNIECISFLKLSRFQIKTNSIDEIFFPNFKVEEYFQLNQQQTQNCLTFIKKKHDEYACGKIKIHSKVVNSKKFYIYTFEKKRKPECGNYILINDQFQIIQMVSPSQIIKQKRQPQNMITIDWTQIFQQYVRPYMRQLKLTKLVKIDVKEYNSILMCSLRKTYDDQYNVLSIKLIKNVKDSINKRREVVLKHQKMPVNSLNRKFEFIYDLSNQNQVQIKGYRKDSSQRVNKLSQLYKKLDKFAGNLRSNLVKATIIKTAGLDKGIKTYRLYGEDMYNIDLQDKQAYIQEFPEINRGPENGQNGNLGLRDLYIIALIISVALVMASLSIFLLYTLNQDMTGIKEGFVKSNQIDRFKVNFYRILAMYRDVASGLYNLNGRDWKPDILQSYNDIHLNRNKKMFSNQKVRMQYSKYTYQGNLNQLVDVILADVFVLTQKYQPELIQNIHDAAILQLANFIEDQQDTEKRGIMEGMTELKNMKDWLLFGITVGVVLFYVLMVCLCSSLVKTMKINLHQFMLISDSESMRSQQDAQKLIYAIGMTKKNFQVDLKGLEIERQKFRPRRKPKEAVLGLNLKMFAGIGIVTCFLINLMIILLFRFMIKDNFEDFILMKAQGQDIIGAYSNICKQTNQIQHTGNLDIDRIVGLRLQLFNIQRSSTQLKFNPQTNQAIKIYFFDDSCQRMYSKGYFQGNDGITCQIATPNYQIQNPFTIGLGLYLTRVHFNLVENISDTFAATGVYSFTFSKVFSQLSNMISNDGQSKLDEFMFQCKLWSFFLVIINVIYCGFAVCLSVFIKKKSYSVQQLIKFLNLRRNKQHRKQDNREKQPLQLSKNINKKRLSGFGGITE